MTRIRDDRERLFARLAARAALFAAPDTLVSADEVAAVLGVSREWVRSKAPAGAAPLGSEGEERRTVYATWAAWLAVLEGRSDEEEADTDRAGPRVRPRAPVRPRASGGLVVLESASSSSSGSRDDLERLGYRRRRGPPGE